MGSTSMENRIPVNDSPEIQQSQPSFSIESLQLAVQNLLKSWHRRQTWRWIFNPAPADRKRAPWRTHLADFLDSTAVHSLVILLLLLDLIITIFELSSSLLPCPPETKKTEKVWYHWVGIAILSMLSARVVALAVGLGGSFFRRPGYVVDGAVVVGALVLEAFFEGRGGGLLIMVSFWRVVRVLESAFELSDDAIKAQIEGIVSQFEALRDENTRLLEATSEKDNTIEKLQEELDQRRRIGNSSSLTY